MKIKEIRELSLEELKTKLTDLKSELFNLRFQHATNQLDNPMKIVETKKSIAKVMTVIKEKEMNA
jgi:large subunit ribosomal protein L29